ncbi:MAG: M20 family metallopeptidase [Candidatus Baltobacteraceae bacterium]
MSIATAIPEALFDDAVALRRDLHRHPELGFSERRTSARVAEILRAAHIDTHEGIATTGVVGVLRGAKPGRTIMLRADMDALPMPDEKDVAYRSSIPGATHACGHDGHVAILLSAARLLAERRDELPGTIVFCFQPAEEGGGGARKMIEEGILERFGIERAYGLHLTGQIPTGVVALRPGPLLASADDLAITIRGRGGHAAFPHLSVDPIYVASSAVVALQSVVARQNDPLEPAVVSICSMHAGTTSNVIPGEAQLSGTVRTFNETVRAALPERIRRVLAGTCEATGASFEFNVRTGFPVTANDPGQAEYVRELLVGTFGDARVVVSPPVMGSEDFSFFAQRVPSCFVFLGARGDERTSYPNHHGLFDIDERALVTGIQLMTALAHGAPAASG